MCLERRVHRNKADLRYQTTRPELTITNNIVIFNDGIIIYIYFVKLLINFI